jgi:hypothetical protein
MFCLTEVPSSTKAMNLVKREISLGRQHCFAVLMVSTVAEGVLCSNRLGDLLNFTKFLCSLPLPTSRRIEVTELTYFI